MIRDSVSIEIEASCEEVFAILHDYSLRLQWDPMLSRAEILDGASSAGKGVRTHCVGGLRQLYLGMTTRYISFKPGSVAAVEMEQSSFLFKKFAASITHTPLTPERSRVEYIFSFATTPAFLSFLFGPMIKLLLRNETEKRLQALKSFVELRSAE